MKIHVSKSTDILKSRLFLCIVMVLLMCALLLLASTKKDNHASAQALTESSQNISDKELSEREEWDTKANQINEVLAKVLPESDFGGVWINLDDGKVNIGVVEDSLTAKESRAIINDKVGEAELTEGAVIKSVKYSFVALEQTRDAIHSLHKENVKENQWPIQMGIKTDVNKVEVEIPKDVNHITDSHRRVLAEIDDKYKDQVVFREYSEIPKVQSCNWWFCDSPLRGGVGIKSSANGYNGIWCTAGIVVEGDSGTKYILTAGHCRSNGDNWSTETYNYTNKMIGHVSLDLYNDTTPIDAMIIKIKEDTYNWNVIGQIYKRAGSSNYDMGLEGYSPPSYDTSYDIQTNSSSVVGNKVCMSGAITGGYHEEPRGGSCGAVQTVGTYVTPIGEPTTFVNRASYCSRIGDSGGPAYANEHKIRGIHRAAGSSECGSDRYFTPINTIINGFDGDVQVY
jgi:hypothetical protein